MTVKKKVLVTGADGFIGSHLTEALVRRGYDVVAFVNYNSFDSWGWLDSCAPDVAGHFDVFSGDVRDPNGVFEAMAGCDAVLHLAALIAIPFSYRSPDSYLDTNVRGTLNVLQAARKRDLEKVVHTSTSEVYGTAQFVPISELHPLAGQSPYSATKIAADQLAYSFFTSFELPVVTMRPFNTFGPRQSLRAVIPTIISQFASGVSSLKLGDVSPTRDFTFVRDTVRGFIAGLESQGCDGEVVNIGSNFEISISDLVSVIAKIMGKEVSIATDHDRLRPKASEVKRLWADNSKAERLMNWTPEFSGLDGLVIALKETISWYEEPAHLKLYKTGTYVT